MPTPLEIARSWRPPPTPIYIDREPEERKMPKLTPADLAERTRNPLRPTTMDEIVGQDDAKKLIGAALHRSKRTGESLPHMLLVGPSGTGKSTFAHVLAHELGTHVYQLAAPVAHDTLLELREVMEDGDVLFVDELHNQAIKERRGKESATSVEALFGLMEDFVIATTHGVLDFPRITFIGATTDEGALPDALINRFPLRPRLKSYTLVDLAVIAMRNARVFEHTMMRGPALVFAIACQGVPRELNNLIRSAVTLCDDRTEITTDDALNVLDLLDIEPKDGLTADQAAMLRFLYLHCRRVTAGEERFQASVATISTGIGKSRDTKAVVLRIEPALIRLGYVQITAGGRRLSDRGITRAQELVSNQKGQEHA